MPGWTERIADLFAQHRRRLEALVTRRVGDRDTAADLVQDAFVRLLAAGMPASGTRPEEEDRRLLYVIARNAAIDHGRSVRRRSDLLSGVLPSQAAAAPATPVQNLTARRALAAAMAALDELPERTRAVFLMRRVEGRSHAEIAEALGISISTVEKHLARALRHCQTRLAPHAVEEQP